MTGGSVGFIVGAQRPLETAEGAEASTVYCLEVMELRDSATQLTFDQNEPALRIDHTQREKRNKGKRGVKAGKMKEEERRKDLQLCVVVSQVLKRNHSFSNKK